MPVFGIDFLFMEISFERIGMKPQQRDLRLIFFAALAVFLGGSLMPSDSRAQSRIEWIDVHFHLVADKGDLESFDEAARMALQVMDAEGIRTIIVMSPPRPRENFDIESLEAVAKKYAPRIVTMGGGGTLNPMLQEAGKSPDVAEEVRRRFEETARGIIASGARGFGEITAHHVSLSPSHGYESVPADHPLLLLLADIAAQHDVPIDLHFDPDRFVLGTDNFIVPTRYTGADAPRIFAQRAEIQRIGVRRLLAHLPPDLARRIGYENAERLYRLDR